VYALLGPRELVLFVTLKVDALSSRKVVKAAAVRHLEIRKTWMQRVCEWLRWVRAGCVVVRRGCVNRGHVDEGPA
jgi:hypothetical protein